MQQYLNNNNNGSELSKSGETVIDEDTKGYNDLTAKCEAWN